MLQEYITYMLMLRSHIKFCLHKDLLLRYSDIMRFLDEEVKANFFPDEIKDQVEALDEEAETTLDAICDYFNYVDEKGFEKSLLQSMSRYVPWYAFWINVRKRIKPTREKKALKCREVLKCDLNRDSVLGILDEKMNSYEKMLGSAEDQKFLLLSSQPTAADIAIFAKICRLTDNLGDMSIGSDVSIDDVIGDRENLKTWYERMEDLSPRRWKGKRVN
mmetsp:Transcript_12075/g.14091  ORF Transcript_12075/g.14091 Transcript_12075/m.14091 type:complete len:218 (-) Transcript_12075:1559-2212(-)